MQKITEKLNEMLAALGRALRGQPELVPVPIPVRPPLARRRRR